MDRDTQQELHQRSPRNVRALLDKEEEEMARQKKAPRMLLYAFIPALILIGVVVIWGIPGRPGPKSVADKRLLDCQMRVWAELSGERERDIREKNPGLSTGDVRAKLHAENATIEKAALKKCEAGAR